MREPELEDLARRAAQHLYDEDLHAPQGDKWADYDWQACLGRAIALTIRDALEQYDRERVARYHEQHRDDPDEWEETAESVQPQLSYVRRARR